MDQAFRYDQALARLKELIENEARQSSEYVAQARKRLGQSYLAQKKFVEAIAAMIIEQQQHYRSLLENQTEGPKAKAAH